MPRRAWFSLGALIVPPLLAGACLYPEIVADDSAGGVDAGVGGSAGMGGVFSGGAAGSGAGAVGGSAAGSGGTAGTAGTAGAGGNGALGRAVHWKNNSCAISNLLGDVTVFNSQSFTVELLVQVHSTTAQYQSLVYRGGSGSGVPSGWTLRLSIKEPDKYAFHFCGGPTGEGGSALCVASALSVDYLEAHHLAVTRDFAKSEARVHLGIVGYPFWTDNLVFSTDWPSADKLSVGGRGSGCSEPVDAVIDELRIWAVMREAAELAAGSAQKVPCNSIGLVAYYAFDEAPGSTQFTDCTGKSGDIEATGTGYEIVDSPFDG